MYFIALVISNFIKVNVTKILLTPSPKSGILGEHALFFHYTSQYGGRINLPPVFLVNLEAISPRCVKNIMSIRSSGSL